MKKISLFCLVIVMIMTSAVCVPFAYATEAEETVESSEVEFLKAIGILDDDLAMNTPVTRGVFAKYVARLCGNVPESTAAAQNYYDVYETDDFCNGVSLLTQLGLLNGYGDGTFLPSRPVSISEAEKVTVDLLGYKYIAHLNGGYPTGYSIAAQNLGLLKGLDTNQKYFYGADLARLIYNAIDVDILMENGVIKSDGESSVNMQKIEGHTILTEKLDMYKGEGVVYANAITNLNGASVNKNQIWIDNFAVNVTNPKHFDLVGCHIEYVYHQEENSNEKTLVYAFSDKDSTLSLTKETFLGIDGLKASYSDDNGKVKKAQLETNVKFVYNGDVVPFDQSLISGFKTGKITLTDSNTNGVYDLVKIENYTSFVAESVNLISSVASESMKAGAVSLDLAADKYTVMQLMNSDDNEVTVDSIAPGNVISYYKNANNSFLKAYVSKNLAEGTLKSIGTTNGSTSYQIGDIIYPIPAGYTGKTAKVGDVITAYLDVFGYIADIKMGTNDGFTAAFLLSSSYDSNGFNDKFYFKVYNKQNKTETLCADKKVLYNGVKTEVKDLAGLLANNMTTLGNSQGIICYKLNEEGLVEAVETCIGEASANLNEDGRLRIAVTNYDKVKTLDFDVANKSKLQYYSSMIDSRAVFDDTSVVFAIANQYNVDSQNKTITPNQTQPYTESQIKAITRNDLNDRDSHFVEAYSLYNDAPRVKAVIIFDNISVSIPRGENLATVISSSATLDENGMDVYQAHIMVEGVEKKITLAETITKYEEILVNGVATAKVTTINRNELKPGDTFRYGTSSDGELDKLEMVYTIADGWKYTWFDGQSVNEPNAQLAYGKVIANDGMYTRIMFDKDSSGNIQDYTGFIQDYYAIPQSHYSKVTVLTIEPRGCTVTAGTIKDAEIGDYVINYRNLMAAVGFVIIKDRR